MVTEVLPERTEASSKSSATDWRRRVSRSFLAFFYECWAPAVRRVEGEFLPGEHIEDSCMLLQAYPKTSEVAPRKHIKTTIRLGLLAWKLFRMERTYNEWEFMSYTGDLSAYHLKRGKRYIQVIPEVFGEYEDLTDAESIWRYAHGVREFICEPSGIMSFKRGKHPHGMILDDVLRDPEKKLDLSVLEKIKRIFLEEVMEMPLYEMHIVGTPQDPSDLFSVIAAMPDFKSIRRPATDKNFSFSLWPEKYPIDVLRGKRTNMGEKAFCKELLCEPVRSAEGFFKSETLDKITWKHLENYPILKPPKLARETFAGFDIGKKSHPSHFAIFATDRNERLIQVHSKWMDGWEYIDQLEYIKEAVKAFNITKLKYDNTRAEFEGFAEEGRIPGGCEGVTFKTGNKYQMSTDLDALVTSGKIALLPDERQRRQLLNVDNDLQAAETDEGHGDSFFSICLAVAAYKEGSGSLAWSA